MVSFLCLPSILKWSGRRQVAEKRIYYCRAGQEVICGANLACLKLAWKQPEGAAQREEPDEAKPGNRPDEEIELKFTYQVSMPICVDLSKRLYNKSESQDLKWHCIFNNFRTLVQVKLFSKDQFAFKVDLPRWQVSACVVWVQPITTFPRLANTFPQSPTRLTDQAGFCLELWFEVSG